MKIFGVDFGKVAVKGLVLEKAATATIEAALTVIGGMGYDTTKLRAILYDGTAIRKILQDNDITTTLSGSSTDAQVPGALTTYNAIQAVAAAGTLAPTSFDASSATNFPSGATLANKYRVTAAGTVQGVVLQVGDIFFPNVSSPSTTTASDWSFINVNVDYASASVMGLIKLVDDLAALNANAGGDANDAVTVAVFNAWKAATQFLKGYEQTGVSIAAGSTGITHNLNSTKLLVQMRDSTGPVHCDWTTSSANAISISSLAAISSVTVTIVAIP